MDAYILDATTLEKIGVLDQSYSSLRWTRRYYAPDSFEMVINRRTLYASELRTGRLLHLPAEGDLCFYIEQTGGRFEGSRAGDLVTVGGRSIEGPALVKRRVVPPPGDSHDRQVAVKAETAMKHYVDAHAGPGAAAAREIPNLVVAADAAAGPTLTVEARYQSILDILREIGFASAMGWEIIFDPVAGDFVFDVIVGSDLTASVYFDPAFETLESWEELASIADSDTTAYVAGQGEGVDREIVVRHAGGVEPSGFARREVFLDARDVELGETAVLQQRGDAHLEATAPEFRYEAKVHQFGSFRYREHWNLGDLILLRNEERGISQPARVVELDSVVTRSAAVPDRTAILDRPFPTLKERVTGGGASGGSVQDQPVTLPPDPHAASHAIGAADAITELVGRGSAFPAQPAYGNNRPFYREDLNREYFYNGTLWLSTQLFAAQGFFDNISANGDDMGAPARLKNPVDSSIYLVAMHVTIFVATGNDATNYWFVETNTFNGSTFTLVQAGTAISLGIGWKNMALIVLNTVVASTIRFVSIGLQKNGTPGNASGNVTWTYRLVGP